MRKCPINMSYDSVVVGAIEFIVMFVVKNWFGIDFQVIDRLALLNYIKEELNIVLKDQTLGHRRYGETSNGMKHESKDRERVFGEYLLTGKQMCQKPFSFAHGVEYNNVRRIASHLATYMYGMAERLQGNKGKNPKNALTVSDINVRYCQCILWVFAFITLQSFCFYSPIQIKMRCHCIGRLPN